MNDPEGIYQYICVIYDKDGRELGRASYDLSVLGDKRLENAKDWLSFSSEAKAKIDELDSLKIVPGAFVNKATADTLPLVIVVGKKGNKWVLLDLTPEIGDDEDPDVHDYDDEDLDEVLADFKNSAAKRYPSGSLHLMTSVLPSRKAPTRRSDMTFDGGHTPWYRSAINYVAKSPKVLMLAGVAAALFDAEPLAMRFFAAAAGVGAFTSAANIVDRAVSGKKDAFGYFIDIAGLAASAIGLAGMKNAMAAARGELLTEAAISSGKQTFVRWTESALGHTMTVVITAKSIIQISKIANSHLPEDEKLEQISDLLEELVEQAGILYIGSKGHSMPAKLAQRASKLAPVEQSVLAAMEPKTLEAVAKLPDENIQPVVALALEKPKEVVAALESPEVKSVADLEAKVNPTKPEEPVHDQPPAPNDQTTEEPAAPKQAEDKAPEPEAKKPVEEPTVQPPVTTPTEPTTTQPPVDHVSGMTRENFIAAYKRRRPRTKFTDDDLGRIYDEGNYFINGKTGLLNKTKTKYPKPAKNEDYVRDSHGDPVKRKIELPPDLRARAEAEAAQRKQYLEDAKQARETDADENEAMHKARLASQKLGEDAALEFGNQQGLGIGRKQFKGKGARDFDVTYEKEGDDPDATILEAKGGGSGLGERWNADKSARVKQGTREYVEAVISDIEKYGDQERALRLRTALESRKLRYYLVTQPFTAANELGAISVMEFKIYD
ncbi:MAG: hypothetical protein QM831_25245 [Kofleriaceae bacterium]